jgi:two-component system nitrogen regulation response regulator GlnG/two-component system response regulator HydG
VHRNRVANTMVVTRDSNFAATSTDSDDTAASTAQVPAWAFVIAWSAEEPHRAGEVAFLPPFQNVLLGRGDQEMEKFMRFGIQRPGEPFAPSPRPGRELFAGTLLSRRQLLLRATADAVEVENLGKCAMLVNGEEKPVATLVEGHTVMLRSRGTRARRSQLLLLCQRRPRTLAGPRVLHAFGEPDDAGIVGEGPGAWNLREQIAGAAQAKVQKILVLGESGTGKEATANAIHRLSKRANGPFVSRNAASFAMSVVDTELFGHPANFPSAGTPERKGLFGQADGGTLFFDEVADCPPEVQARLLRVLDKGEYQRVSESIARRVDIRFVGATNLDERTLRKELFGRFERIVRVPPLRQRREDIPLLIRHWVLRRVEGDADLTSRYLQPGPTGKAEPKINGRLVDYLLRQELPLNVRELYAFLESTLSNPEDDLRLPKSMDPERTGVPPENPASTGDDGDGGIREDGLPSKVKLLAYLERAGGNVSEVARQVGKGRKVIYRLMEEYGIKGEGTDPQ